MTFALIGGDARAVRLCALLRADGHAVRPFALERALPDCEKTAEAAASGADCILLPLPCEKNGALFAPLSDRSTTVEAALSAAAPGTRVFAGQAGEGLRSLCRRRGLPLTDFLRREDFARRNAALTAEGAVGLLLRGEKALIDSRVLVVGYGRIGSRLARTLRALGAEVTVAARRSEDRTAAALEGCRAIRIRDAAGPGWDAVLNTVPAQLFDGDAIAAFGSARLMELASAPYGFDLDAARGRVELCAGLPGKCAPVSAAMALRDTIYAVLEE